MLGESQVSNDFPKIVDKIPDDRDGIVANRGLVEMLESLFVLADYRPSLSTTNVQGRRLALVITALRAPPMHRRTALKANLKTFVWLEFRSGPE